jgi:hypothetical protein
MDEVLHEEGDQAERDDDDQGDRGREQSELESSTCHAERGE